MRVFKCELCGNIVEEVRNGGGQLVCCGRPMKELVAGESDGAVEKHVPVFEVSGNKVSVKVGSAEHPMLAEHFIEWISLETDKGIYRKTLTAGEKPEAEFCIADGESVKAVYEHCNLHGLFAAK